MNVTLRQKELTAVHVVATVPVTEYSSSNGT